MGLIPCTAETILIGTFSFDPVIPGDVIPGVNGFSIANLSGPLALPPDFPTLTPVLLDITATLHEANGATTIIGLGSLGPDFHTPISLQFPDTQLFLSAMLTVDISPLQLSLADGRLLTIQNSHIEVPLTPLLGTTLSAGLDLALISVEATDIEAIPEPGGLGRVSPLLLLALVPRRRHS